MQTSTTAQGTIAKSGIGIDMNTSSQGSGKTNFNLHVADRSLKFKSVPTNHSILTSLNNSMRALGRKGLDVTNVKRQQEH